MQKPTLFLCLLMAIPSIVKAQHGKRSYYDANWQPSGSKEASYIAYTQKIDDTTWQSYYYRNGGPLVKLETFKDNKLTIQNGRLAWYDKKGITDSTGFVFNGIREGFWYYYNDECHAILSKKYQLGRVIETKELDPELEKKGPLPGDVFAEFAGGEEGWRQYLIKKLNYPQSAIKYNYQGEARIAFYVETSGKVTGPWIFKSIEPALDEEAIRLIKISPDWTTGTRNGKPILNYMIQPIIFKLQ